MYTFGFAVVVGLSLLLLRCEASQLSERDVQIARPNNILNGNELYRRLQNEPVLTTKTTVSGSGQMLRTAEQQKLGNPAGTGELRTATGGFVYTLLVTLTVLAFLSNGAFLVYVFWLSK